MTEIHSIPDASLTGQLTEREADMALAGLIAGGDQAAFELLMRRHNRRLFRLARATLRNDAEAEDALQESYLAAYRSIEQFRGDAALTTWLSRFVLNECLGRLRRQTRRDNIVPISSANNDPESEAMSTKKTDSPDNALMRSQMRLLLECKLDALPEAFRTVFVLRCVEEMTVDETALCLAIPEATVRSRLFRAKTMLRESLAGEIDMAQHDVYEFGGRHCDRVVRQTLLQLK